MPDAAQIRQSIVEDLAHYRERLQRWESGQFTIGEVDCISGEHNDLTPTLIAETRRIIAEYERIIEYLTPTAQAMFQTQVNTEHPKR